MTDKTKLVLEKLAEKLNVSVDQLYAALVKQAAIVFWTDIIQMVVVFAMLVLCTALAWRNRECDTDNEQFVCGISTIIGTILLFVFIVMFCQISDTIAAGYNPDYWAFKQIIKSR